MKVKLILDASGENLCPDGFTPIDAETDFLQRDGDDEPLFVRGDALCQWARALCRARGLREGDAYRDLPSPRQRLRLLLGDKADEVTLDVLRRAVVWLEQNANASLGDLLAHLTGAQFWADAPSPEHAAQWLLAPVAPDLAPLAEALRAAWASGCRDEALSRVYAAALIARRQVLQDWLRAEGERAGLGLFPFALTGEPADWFVDWWGEKLRASEGRALDHLPAQHPNAALIARAAYAYLRHHKEHLTDARVSRLVALTPPQQRELKRLVPRGAPPPLPPEANEQEALAWAEDYLVYREWQVGASVADEVAQLLADSFSDWLLEHYPRLTTISYERSPLNLRGKHVVAELAQQYQVLWVVVDGLSYLNHQRLLRLLARTDAALGVEQDDKVFAVLPTITERAKYGLTSGQLPAQNLKGQWEIRRVFADTFSEAAYAGSADVGKIKAALQHETARVIYWNMTGVDECYHEQTDFDALTNSVEARLSALAKDISQLVTAAAAPERVAVVIATDHGQMIGPCVRHAQLLTDATTHGRTAKGDPFNLALGDRAYLKTPDGSAVALNPKRFGLSEPTTLALGAYHFNQQKNASGQAWGVHGGLSPEEVVVGLAVLRVQPARRPIAARVVGEGEVGHPACLTLRIDNPNAAAIRVLTLKLNEIDEWQWPQSLPVEVAKLAQATSEIDLARVPAPPVGDNLALTGQLTYEFADGVRQECVVTGALTCKQMYSGQRPSLRDRFKK